MMSAMPAVAIRRERSKSKERIRQPTTKRGRLAEYYHRKISRVGSMRPTTRSYSEATSPDTELPPELMVEVDPYEGRCSKLRRTLGYMSFFHAGCVLIVIGLIVIFLSMGSIKADVATLRALGSFNVALGALLCLLRTIFFKKPEPLHLRVLRLKSSDSFATRSLSATESKQDIQNPGFSPGITMEVIHELPTSPDTSTELSSPQNGGFRILSPPPPPPSSSSVTKSLESNETDRSPSPLRPTSTDKMLPGSEGEKSM